MKTLYLECNMGAAGDMLMAALLELHPNPQTFLDKMNTLGLPGVSVSAAPAVRCGITGTHVSVTVHGAGEESVDVPSEHHHERHDGHGHHHGHGRHHHHTGPGEIGHLISHLDLPEAVKADARAVYDLIARAESHAHGCPVEEIHFHEVGALDAVADVVGVCLLIHQLAPQRIVASPVHVGCGQVRCAHGVMPVPAPATAWLLREAPTYGGAVRGELCTPTGAALLKYFAAEFGPQPVMRVNQIGYGMGQKEFEAANCLRAMLGETEEKKTDTVAELRCNLDDMTPEAIGFAVQTLLEAGALDVYTTPVQMKKGRPGILLTLLCRETDREAMARLIFLHTTTLGVRETLCGRYVLRRKERAVETPLGRVRIKTAGGYGVERSKPEYEDVARIARERGMSLPDVLKQI